MKVKKYDKDGFTLDMEAAAADIEKIEFLQLPNANECKICDEDGGEHDPTGEGFKPKAIFIYSVSPEGTAGGA
jgi:hypothetical protein